MTAGAARRGLGLERGSRAPTLGESRRVSRHLGCARVLSGHLARRLLPPLPAAPVGRLGLTDLARKRHRRLHRRAEGAEENLLSRPRPAPHDAPVVHVEAAGAVPRNARIAGRVGVRQVQPQPFRLLRARVVAALRAREALSPLTAAAAAAAAAASSAASAKPSSSCSRRQAASTSTTSASSARYSTRAYPAAAARRASRGSIESPPAPTSVTRSVPPPRVSDASERPPSAARVVASAFCSSAATGALSAASSTGTLAAR